MAIKITLINGPSTDTIEVDDASQVQEVLAAYRNVYNIPQNATATVNGKTASGNTELHDGDEVAFTKPTGQKG